MNSDQIVLVIKYTIQQKLETKIKVVTGLGRLGWSMGNLCKLGTGGVTESSPLWNTIETPDLLYLCSQVNVPKCHLIWVTWIYVTFETVHCKNYYSFQSLSNGYTLCYLSTCFLSPSLLLPLFAPFSLSPSDFRSCYLLIFPILGSHSSNSVEVDNVF